METINCGIACRKNKTGLLSIEPTMPLNSMKELSYIYAPTVGEISKKIEKDSTESESLTISGKTIAVISNGTAVLGYGDIGPLASLPVTEAKAFLMKNLGNVDAFPLCVNTQNAEEVIQTISSIALGFRGIHLEDIKAPECFYIEKELQRKLNIPVYHDDQHGTSIVVLAALINAVKIVKKEMDKIKIVINGAGASGIATAKLLREAGATNILLCDKFGILNPADSSSLSNEYQKEVAGLINSKNISGDLNEALSDADVFIGLSEGNVLTEQMIKNMKSEPIIFALAIPSPEVSPEIAVKAGAKVVATGLSEYPNQVNNLLVFPGLFRGVLDYGIRKITEQMKLEIAGALAGLVTKDELTSEYIIPDALNPSIVPTVAEAIAMQGYMLNKSIVRQSG